MNKRSVALGAFVVIAMGLAVVLVTALGKGRFFGGGRTQAVVWFDKSVKAALIASGMPSAFDQQRADLSGIVSGVRLAINDVAHATFLRVDEEGTEAAAATAVTIVVTSARIEPQVPEMVVDRPFLATLRDRKSGAVLFFGRIADPTAIP